MNPYLEPYTMPDATTRRAIVERVPALNPESGNGLATGRAWSLPDDWDDDSYFEGRYIICATFLRWAATQLPTGVLLNKSGGAWAVSNQNGTASYSGTDWDDTMLLAMHSVADLKGFDH